jgi:MFS family permease
MSDPEKNPEAGGGVAESLPTAGAQSSTPTQTRDNISISSSEKALPGQDGTALEKTKSETPSQAEGLGKARIAVIMLSLCIALFLAALDMTIITTALPTIASHFTATSSDYTWVGSAYLLANAASVPLWGKLSDIWGRKPVILLANVVFLVGSLLCAVAVSIGMLIGGRVVQGVGGGGSIILVNIVISDLFSMRDRAKYFGLVGMTWALASAVGPVLGGVFTEKVSWRWCVSANREPSTIAFRLLTCSSSTSIYLLTASPL